MHCGMAEWARAGQLNGAVLLARQMSGYLSREHAGMPAIGRLGVVADQPCCKSLLLPRIKVFFSPRGIGLNGKRK